MNSFPPLGNFGYSTVRVAPSPALTGLSFECETGEGDANFPDTDDNGSFLITAWPIGDQPVKSNAEILRVTRSGDVFTVVERHAEESNAQPIDTDYQIAMTITSERMEAMAQAEYFFVDQTAHGFDEGDAIYHNGTTWELAQADDELTLATHIVGAVFTTNRFVAVRSGRIIIPSHGLTVGEYYFLSHNTPGALVLTPNASNYTQLLVYVEDADTIHVLGNNGTKFAALSHTHLLAAITDVTASVAEVNVLDGMTASTAELNVLDGITADTAELNILNGATLSTAELNLLDGVTATTTELNYVDTTVGTATASKAVILDSNKDYDFDTGDIAATIATFDSIDAPFPDSMVLNGKFVISVSSNNITLALKDRNGNDPSATSPVKIIINNTIRTLTAALSVTKNAGTSWANAGSADLATKEIDWFIYLAWDSSNSTVRIGFARIPYARLYSDFSGTTTNEKYGAFNTNPGSTDDAVNVGRFAATLSASASFNWSVPTFTTKNLIQRPIYKTRRLTYVCNRSVAGGGTAPSYAAQDINEYQIDMEEVSLNNYWQNDSGGTAGAGTGRFIISIPFGVNNSSGYFMNGYSFENAGTITDLIARFESSTQFKLTIPGTLADLSGNDQSSAQRQIGLIGKYFIA